MTQESLVTFNPINSYPTWYPYPDYQYWYYPYYWPYQYFYYPDQPYNYPPAPVNYCPYCGKKLEAHKCTEVK